HHDLSAVDDDRLAGDVARLVRAQEDDGVRDVLGLDLLAERGEGVVVRDDLLGSNPLLLRRGADVLRVPDLRALENVARSDAVHSNPIASELERPASHEVDLARFRGVVGAVRFARLEARLARQVDDDAADRLPNEDPRRGSSHEKVAREIDLERLAPEIERKVDERKGWRDSGGVDEEIDAAGRLENRLERLVDGLLARDVATQGEDFARATRARDFAHRLQIDVDAND